MRIGIKPANYFSDVTRFRMGYDYSDIPILFESGNIDFDDLFEYKGKIYRVIMRSVQHNILLVSPIDIDLENEQEICANRIKCPVCGCWECPDEDDNYECGGCGAILQYSTEIIRTCHVTVKETPKINRAITTSEDATSDTLINQ
jgi:hypothetical protein